MEGATAPTQQAEAAHSSDDVPELLTVSLDQPELLIKAYDKAVELFNELEQNDRNTKYATGNVKLPKKKTFGNKTVGLLEVSGLFLSGGHLKLSIIAISGKSHLEDGVTPSPHLDELCTRLEEYFASSSSRIQVAPCVFLRSELFGDSIPPITFTVTPQAHQTLAEESTKRIVQLDEQLTTLIGNKSEQEQKEILYNRFKMENYGNGRTEQHLKELVEGSLLMKKGEFTDTCEAFTRMNRLAADLSVRHSDLVAKVEFQYFDTPFVTMCQKEGIDQRPNDDFVKMLTEFHARVANTVDAVKQDLQLNLDPKQIEQLLEIRQSDRTMDQKNQMIEEKLNEWGIVECRAMAQYFGGGRPCPDPARTADATLRCAEDNALIYLVKYLKSSKPVVKQEFRATWYTRALSIQDKEEGTRKTQVVQRKPLCNVCDPTFMTRFLHHVEPLLK